jgi:hypothetical protein
LRVIGDALYQWVESGYDERWCGIPEALERQGGQDG